MQIAILGLGRMGKNMALLLRERGHDVIGWNRGAEPREEVARAGVRTVDDHREVAGMLAPPRVVWLMLPAGEATEQVLADVLQTLSPGDVLINGANQHYKETLRQNTRVSAAGVRFLDIGVSGGTLARELGGYCCMVGGDEGAFRHIEPVLRSLCVPDGYGHMGPSGSGHYVKMVHNAIEYATMQAIAEGFHLLKHGQYPTLDLRRVASVYNHGSILAGTLMTATERALSADPDLKGVAPYIDDTGEGRWTVIEAIEKNVPFTTAAYALFERMMSRDPERYSQRLVAAQRNAFGSHSVKRG